MRFAVAMALLLTGLAVAACGGDAGLPVPTPTKPGALPANLTTVTVTDFRFEPMNLTVPVGTRVTWSFRGDVAHSVVGLFGAQTIDSGAMRRGNFEFVFDAPGEFVYRCGIHGEAMAGRVTAR